VAQAHRPLAIQFPLSAAVVLVPARRHWVVFLALAVRQRMLAKPQCMRLKGLMLPLRRLAMLVAVCRADKGNELLLRVPFMEIRNLLFLMSQIPTLMPKEKWL
jgi:hypothetical protein